MIRRLKEATSLVLTFLIGALTNIATGSLPEEWKPYLWLSWAPLGACFLIVLILQFAPEQRGRWGRADAQQAGDDQTITSLRRRNRSRMLQKVRDFWIRGVLERSLFEAISIEPRLEHAPDAVDRRGPPYVPSLAGKTIVDAYHEFGGELLILGDPGSGKTTLLLELARELIGRAEQDEDLPIPVVFNLSSWSVEQLPLAEWLVEELRTKYDVPASIGQMWMDAEMLLPLLDGLDEVSAADRARCAEAINAFRSDHGLMPLVVCSRMTEQRALPIKLRLRGAVVALPLTYEQIDANLERAGPRLAAVRAALQGDTVLQELAATPLMLSIIALTYQDTDSQAEPLDGALEKRRDHLLARYVQRMFEWRSQDPRYTPQQTTAWLAWLARAITEQAQTMFFLERLQPNYLTARSQRVRYAVCEGLAWGLFAGLTAVIANGLVVFLSAAPEWLGWRATPWFARHLWMGWLGGLVGGLAGGLAGGLIARLTFDENELLTPAQTGRISSIRNAVRVGATVGLAVGMARGLAVEWVYGAPWGLVRGLGWGIGYGLAVGLGYGIVATPGRIEVVEILRWSWSKARTQIVPSLQYGVVLGLVVGLAVGIVNGIAWSWDTGLADGLVLWLAVGVESSVILLLIRGVSVGEIDTRTMPNQGIWRSAHNALRFGIAIWLVGGLVMAGILAQFPSWGLSYALSFGLGGGFMLILVGGLLYGGIACIQHVVLRIILWRAGQIPWRYTRFLDYCADRIFLRKVGGGYIFVHRLLMEYFASLKA